MRGLTVAAVLVALVLLAVPGLAAGLPLEEMSLGGALVFPIGDEPTQLQADVAFKVLREGDTEKLGRVPLAGPVLKWVADNGRLDALIRSKGGTLLPNAVSDITADLGASLRVYTVRGNLPMNLGFVYERHVGGCWFIGGGADLSVLTSFGLAPRPGAGSGWAWALGPGSAGLSYTRGL